MSAITPDAARRIKVVTLVDYLTLAGGAERLALQVATRLNPERFESIVSVSRFPAPPGLRLRDSDLEAYEQLKRTELGFLPLERRRKLELRPWIKLARFLRRERVDVLHAHKFGSNVWGTLAGVAARVPVILAHEHTWSFQGQPLRRLLDRELIARGASRIIAVSRADQRRMTEVERIDPDRIVFVPNGVVALAPPTGTDVRAELGIDSAAPVIGVVGMLRPQKAHEVLLRATSTLIARFPDLRVLIAGDGPERASLERAAAELGVQANVLFLGERTDIPDLLAALDLAVSCSDFEGSPLSVMEYMDAGLAVVATAVGGVPDLIVPGVHGLLVPARDDVALAAAIADLLSEPERARTMGARARERRRKEFDIDVQVRALEALYTELLDERARRRPRSEPSAPGGGVGS
jgi:glycosyltransferase involved in cell wall biosynthesis